MNGTQRREYGGGGGIWATQVLVLQIFLLPQEFYVSSVIDWWPARDRQVDGFVLHQLQVPYGSDKHTWRCAGWFNLECNPDMIQAQHVISSSSDLVQNPLGTRAWLHFPASHTSAIRHLVLSHTHAAILLYLPPAFKPHVTQTQNKWLWLMWWKSSVSQTGSEHMVHLGVWIESHCGLSLAVSQNGFFCYVENLLRDLETVLL